MSEPIQLTGMVLAAFPSGDYDRRVILLTRERGKITAFARGARRQGNALLGTSVPFCFGRFKLYEGRTAYTLAAAEISEYFSAVKEDLDASLYGFYFMELADYYGRENLDASMMLNLLYISLRALEKPSLRNRLVRYVFEIRLMVINGEFPPSAGENDSLSEAGKYMIDYAAGAPMQRLYTFTVTDGVLAEVGKVLERIRRMTFDRRMKSLELLEENERFTS